MKAARRRRVLFIVSEYVEKGNPLGGIFFRDQALTLQRLGLRVDVVYVEPRSLRELSLGAIRESHFQVMVNDEDGILTMRRRGWNPMTRSVAGAMVWRLMTERLVEEYLGRFGCPDLVHAHNTIWAGCIAHRVCSRRGLPYVITEHSSLFLMGQTPRGGRRFLKETLRAADKVLAVSRKLSESMRLFSGAREIEVVPNMVDIDLFTQGPPKRTSPYVFLAIAHFNRNKGLDILIRAFAAAFRGDPATRLIIGGNGPERERLQALVAEVGVRETVDFLGHLTRIEVRDAMHAANVLVHPSYNETFGIVLIEALATGIPVIATRCGGPEEIVTEELGLLVDPGSVEELAAALRTMRATQHYSPEGLRANVSRRFGAETIGRRLEGIYEDVILTAKKTQTGSA